MPDTQEAAAVAETVPRASLLFRQCRLELGLSVEQMQDGLCVRDKETIERIERGVLDVIGPNWVALWFMLTTTAGEAEAADSEPLSKIERLRDLADQVEVFIDAIHLEAARRRQDRAERSLHRKRRAAAQEGSREPTA
jgi:hypothetical protein